MDKKQKLKSLITDLLFENLMNDLVPGGNKELGKFLGTVEEKLSTFTGDLEKLIAEADGMIAADLALNANFGERNRALMQTSGVLKKLKTIVISANEGLHKGMGFIKST